MTKLMLTLTHLRDDWPQESATFTLGLIDPAELPAEIGKAAEGMARRLLMRAMCDCDDEEKRLPPGEAGADGESSPSTQAKPDDADDTAVGTLGLREGVAP